MDTLDIEWRQKITYRLMQGDFLRKAGDTIVLRQTVKETYCWN
jgi:hypothetical protein